MAKVKNWYKNVELSKTKIAIMIVSILVTFLVLNTLVEAKIIPVYFSKIMILISIFVIMAVSLNVATGFLGQLVLGHAGFMAIGAYAAALTGMAIRESVGNDLIMFIIAAFSAMIFAGIAGVLVGVPALRLRGDYLGIMTLGFGEIVKVILTNLKGLTGGAQGLIGIPRIMDFKLAFIVATISVVAIWLFMKSRHGRAILSIREDEIASESVGINLLKYKLMGFIITAAMGGLGGAVFAFTDGILAPTSFGFIKSIEIFVIVVLGGMGSISGSIIAAVFLISIPEIFREFASYRMLAYSTLLVFVMLFRPQGLMGTREFNLNFLDKPLAKLHNKIYPEGSDPDVNPKG